jgi:flagellar secretion chaperone FliS
MQHTTYLESKVLTAPPQRLHLLLIEGAIRYGRQAEESLRQGQRTAAMPPLLRVIDIVGELLAGVRADNSDLNKKIADIYWFLFRRVSEAKVNADVQALSDALRVLDYERQTWQLLCDKLSSDHQGGSSAPPAHAFGSKRASGVNSGFSLEA